MPLRTEGGSARTPPAAAHPPLSPCSPCSPMHDQPLTSLATMGHPNLSQESSQGKREGGML